jgi:acetoacetyl-CoA synthetase
VLTVGPQIVGFLGVIYSRHGTAGQDAALVCNLTSWYIRPEYRGWGSFLLAAAMRDKGTTYTSLTPGPETRAMMKALGFAALEKRRLFLPLLNAGTFRTDHLHLEYEHERIRGLLNERDRRIFDDHAAYDLLHLVAREGPTYAYLILKRRVIRSGRLIRVPASELLYCSDPRILVRHFERIKLAVLRRQRTLVFASHEGFVPTSIRSAHKAKHDRYRSSGGRPSSNLDLLYSELVLLPI